MVTKIPRHRGKLFDGADGPWWLPRIIGGEVSANVKCPYGHIADLDSHTIDETGTVTPSIICSGDHEGTCNWHAFIILNNW